MSDLARFNRKIRVSPAGCWEWTASRCRDGYSWFKVGGVAMPGHRWSYAHFVSLIAPGLEIDHLCRNRACVNPAHLEVVSHGENMRRGGRASQTTCKNGHPFNAENTYRRIGGGRDCRACICAAQRRYQQRKRGPAI